MINLTVKICLKVSLNTLNPNPLNKNTITKTFISFLPQKCAKGYIY